MVIFDLYLSMRKSIIMLLKNKDKKVYIHIDLDVLNPAIALCSEIVALANPTL